MPASVWVMSCRRTQGAERPQVVFANAISTEAMAEDDLLEYVVAQVQSSAAASNRVFQPPLHAVINRQTRR